MWSPRPGTRRSFVNSLIRLAHRYLRDTSLKPGRNPNHPSSVSCRVESLSTISDTTGWSTWGIGETWHKAARRKAIWSGHHTLPFLPVAFFVRLVLPAESGRLCLSRNTKLGRFRFARTSGRECRSSVSLACSRTGGTATGAAGFEPAASWSEAKCSVQAELSALYRCNRRFGLSLAVRGHRPVYIGDLV